jgi:hypothetical protein
LQAKKEFGFAGIGCISLLKFRVMFIVAGFVAGLLIIDSLLYFRHADHFFQADGIYFLNHRVHSVLEFLQSFVQLHPSGWYRPLSAEPIVSILYPVFGLRPVPYHIAVYAIFLCVTAALYVLVAAISGRRLLAAATVAFFSIHSVNAYSTFDIAFIPELLYTLFYLCAVIGYVAFLRHGRRSGYVLSLVCFAASLFSKESAVTLPGVLILTHILFEPGENSVWVRAVRAAKSCAAHAVILIAYVGFVGGYLRVQNFSLHDAIHPQSDHPGYYALAVNGTILSNADLAFSWAFNIPRGWWMQWRHISPGSMLFLKGFRVFILLGAIVLLPSPERKLVLWGTGWLFLTILPALPLVDHFIPYYLFLGMAGFSLVVGAVCTWSYDILTRFQPALATAFILTVLAANIYVTSREIRQDVADNRLLGGSARLALNPLMDLKRLYPELPPAAIVYFEDRDAPLNWDQDGGGLLQMAYNRKDISAKYASLDDTLLDLSVDNTVVLSFRGDHLVDETASFRRHPERLLRVEEPSTYKLTLSKTEVTAGADDYDIKVTSAGNSTIRVHYTVNQGPIKTFTTALDSDGRVTLHVSSDVTKGVYSLLLFNILGQHAWIRANADLVVR